MFSNENRRLKRQMKRQLSSTLNDSREPEESSESSDSLLLAVTSPVAKRQSTYRLFLQKTSRTTITKFHLERLNLGVKPVGKL